MLKLVKRSSMKRNEFHDRGDYLHVRQVHALVKLALDMGATVGEVRALLENHDGGFDTWDWLWEETP